MKLKLQALAYSSVLLLSCGSHHDQDSSSNPVPKDDSKKTGLDSGKKGEPDSGKKNGLALKSLEKFETWKANLLKECNISNAFETQSFYQSGIDAKVFFERTKSSLLLKGKDGEFLIFDKPVPASGSESSNLGKWEDGVYFEASFRRDGAKCDVYISGNHVYSTEIFQTVPALAHWYPNKKNAETTLANSIVEYFPSTKYAFISNHRFTKSIFEMMNPDRRTKLFIAEYFKISELQSKLRFFDYSLLNLSHIASLPQQKDVLPFGSNANKIYGTASTLETLLAKPAEFPLTIKIKPPYLGSTKFSNSADKHNWVLNANVSVKPEKDTLFEYSASSLELAPPTPFSDKESVECMLRRTKLLREVPNSDWPHFGDAEGSCYALSTDFGATILNSKELKNLLLEFLLQVRPAPKADYKDWDTALKKLIKRLMKDGKDAVKELDPENKVPLIKTLSTTMQNMKELLKSHPKLHEHHQAFTELASTKVLQGRNASDIESTFSKPIWSKCTDTEFQTHENTLRNLLTEWKSKSDWSEQNKIESKILNLLKECT